VLNLAGQTSILEDCAVLAQTQVFVGNDSGLGHMASAVGTPTLTVFGPTDALRYRPWGRHADWLCEPEGRLEALSGAAVAARLRLHLEALGSAADAAPNVRFHAAGP
ncbi:MAG: glycosyltransferase family 9 protein, partial [Gammaproteobacteria bacterium]